MERFESIKETIIELASIWGMKLLSAIIVLIIGLWIIGWIVRLIKKGVTKRELDPSLSTFLLSMAGIVLKVLLIISVTGMLGVEMTSFIALLGAAGLAVGMALSGTLQNFAGSIMILIFKPYKVNDFIEAQGYMGVVKEIQIFNTIILTPDNRTVIIPNGGLSSGSMINYSTQPIRRVDLVVGIGYTDDIDKARKVIYDLLKKNDKVLNEPAPFVGVTELGDNSVNFVVRPWVKGEHYWDTFFTVQEEVKKAFDNQNISIPFPQRDVHIYNETK